MMWDSLPGGRASLALPRAILRVATEKAGAGGCRLGVFGVNRDCREMPKKVFDFPNELIDKVIEIS